MDLEAFKAELKRDGYNEVLEKTYAPNQLVGKHVHDFSARALVTAGDMVINWSDVSRSYRTGEIFEVQIGDEHSEQYGPQGATYLVGRKFA